MSMGAVLFRTGRIAASELGGLYRTMPLTSSMCIVGAASISGVPLFASFVSKSMILSATLVAGYDAAWLALLFASAGALLYAGIKVPYFAFFGKDSGLRPREAPVCMLVAMAIAAAGGILLGIWPEPLLRLLPFEATYDPYSAAHVLAQCQLLLFSALAFVWLRRWRLYPEPVAGINLDVDWLYRRVLPETGRRVATALRGGGRVASAMVREAYGTGLHALLRWHGPDGILARDPIGSYAMLAVVALLVVVLLLALVFGTPA